MACQRDGIIKIVEYLESLGIIVNLGKNKARGNKGFFKVKGSQYRIDIANNVDEEDVLPLLVHEFAHYLHYSYDRSLKSLGFIFDNNEDDLQEEMIALTVQRISKKSIEPLFKAKSELEQEILNTSGVALELRKHALRRINSKISRLNRYYNQPTELFARAMEMYFTSNSSCRKFAPHFSQIIDKRLTEKNLPVLSGFASVCQYT